MPVSAAPMNGLSNQLRAIEFEMASRFGDIDDYVPEFKQRRLESAQARSGNGPFTTHLSHDINPTADSPRREGEESGFWD
jgi:hypothetical protein